MQKVISLCKRRGFVYPNSEIYGGLAGFYDFGPLGIELKNNIQKAWWKEMISSRDNVVGIDGSIITHPKVWEASGHIEGFTDPMVDCKKCKKRFRADDLAKELEVRDTGVANEDLIEKLKKALKNTKCPECKGELTEPKRFNLLVEAGLGVIEGEKKKVYLRGEACQTIYLNYKNVLDSMRMKIPFGIAQIGKAFRNEITPKNFLYRQREFEQWDLQWFCHPKEMEKWYEFWKQERMKWYKSLLNNKGKIRFRKHESDELAHYAKIAFDIEYETPFDWKEWEGIHWRGDWDLSRHGKFSNNDFTYTDPDTKEKFLPHIVETSGGVDRTFLFLLLDAYCEDRDRVVLKLKPELAPYKVAVFPLLANKPKLVEKAREIYDILKPEFSCAWDARGNIGKRYYSQDEVGTFLCVTVDFESLEDDTVTMRDRNTTQQIRVKIKELKDIIEKLLKSEIEFEKAGELIQK
ncbi:MAG: glycine--tRNA ligase [Candidatus Pacebacteria bacterium]|nr:glycine--tRNA ligase [Candidatus Paceibacterota bacterium]